MLSDKLKFVKQYWKIFPTNVIYSTSCSRTLITKEEDAIYLYSIHRVADIKIKKLDIGSIFFDIYQVKSGDLTTAVGYIFIPLQKGTKIRYTSVALTSSSHYASKEAVLCCERKVLFSDNIYVIWLSCNAEIITILPNMLGVYPT